MNMSREDLLEDIQLDVEDGVMTLMAIYIGYAKINGQTFGDKMDFLILKLANLELILGR